MSEDQLRQMIVEAREACYSEYMNCPWCEGHIGIDNEWHAPYCDFLKFDTRNDYFLDYDKTQIRRGIK